MMPHKSFRFPRYSVTRCKIRLLQNYTKVKNNHHAPSSHTTLPQNSCLQTQYPTCLNQREVCRFALENSLHLEHLTYPPFGIQFELRGQTNLSYF